jgi:hypothetical protein
MSFRPERSEVEKSAVALALVVAGWPILCSLTA